MENKNQNKMKVNFSITWGKTKFYEEGQRHLTMDWRETEGFPRKGEAINIAKFIRNNYESNETFTYKNEDRNVFEWIENVIGWQIEEVKWDYENGAAFLHVFIEERR